MLPPIDLAPPPAQVLHVRDERVRLNTVGYVIEATKQATIASDVPTTFRILRLPDGASVYEGHTLPPRTTPLTETNETVEVADFSNFVTPGNYQLEVQGVGCSDAFSIDPGAWNIPYYAVTRGMYLWRCGTAVDARWRGINYHHDACHTDDGWLDYVGGGHVHRDSKGGWHDAGDYNKYVVNAGVSVGMMFKAWEQFRGRIGNIALNLPESGNAQPDLLNELRWELDWLFTMQMEDGRVYHKVSSLNFRYWGPPDRDLDPRYFAPWSTVATADFAGMMANAARVFKPFDPAYAGRCLDAARKAWAVLEKNPTPVEPDLHEFHTGGYKANDQTSRLWAAAELWETTGEKAFLGEFEHRAASLTWDNHGPTWGDVRALAFGTYLLTGHPDGRDPALVGRLQTELLAVVGRILNPSQESGYGRLYGTEKGSWYWGANGDLAAQTYLFHVADALRPDPAYRRAAHEALSFLFGRNFHGRSYITGVGARPPEHPHDRRGEPAWPGYLVGGGWPDGRSWEDKQANFRVNEIAINWNAALIYSLSAFVDPVDLHRGDALVPEGGVDALPANASGTITYTLVNRGTGPLTIDSISFSQAQNCRPQADLRTSVKVAPGDHVSVRIQANPTTDAWSCALNLSLNGDTHHPLHWTLQETKAPKK